MHRNKILFNKPNRCTKFFQIYFCQENLHVSGSSSALLQVFSIIHSVLVYNMQVWWQLSSTSILEFYPYAPPSPGMRSWREWDLELCLSLHSLQVIHRDTAFTAIVGYSRILCTNNLTHIFFQSVVPQCETKIHVILRLSSKRKGRVNGIPTKRTVWTEITWLFFYFIPLFHQLPFHVQNINCTRQAPTKCIGIVCLWTEVWRAF